jgi:dTDP-4-amino-4,6-dideoxygalactose transaminase
VDCRTDHLIDPDAIAAAITDRTRGIMPVQLNGRTSDMGAIGVIAERHGLFIVEDACQALGAKYAGRQAGSFGRAGAISFYPSKTLGCFGDGGAILTNDDDVADHIRLLRDHGRDEHGDIRHWGYNSRLDNLQAAILRIKLASYDDRIERRREIASLYQARLGELEQLVLPPAPGSEAEQFDIFQNYEIEADRRDELRSFLAERGIGTILQWGGKTIQQYHRLGFNVSLPYTERMVERFMLLPLNLALGDDDIHYVCDGICDFYSQ